MAKTGKDRQPELAQLPLSHRVDIRTLPNSGLRLFIEPDQGEREAIKSFYDLADLTDFAIEAHLLDLGKRRFRLEGAVRAHVAQNCVVTFAPVYEDIFETFDITLVPEQDMEPYLERVETDGSFSVSMDDEIPDPYRGQEIDVAALALEYFALGLTPYPHAEGVDFQAHMDEKEEKNNPFAQLVSLKTKLKPN